MLWSSRLDAEVQNVKHGGPHLGMSVAREGRQVVTRPLLNKPPASRSERPLATSSNHEIVVCTP